MVPNTWVWRGIHALKQSDENYIPKGIAYPMRRTTVPEILRIFCLCGRAESCKKSAKDYFGVISQDLMSPILGIMSLHGYLDSPSGCKAKGTSGWRLSCVIQTAENHVSTWLEVPMCAMDVQVGDRREGVCSSVPHGLCMCTQLNECVHVSVCIVCDGGGG